MFPDSLGELHINFPQFEVTRPSDYEISFYATADCQSASQEACKDNLDYLSLSVDGKQLLKVELAGLAAKKKWEPFSAKLQTNSSNFKVLRAT